MRNTDLFFKSLQPQNVYYMNQKDTLHFVWGICVCVCEGSRYEDMICWQANVISRRNGNVNLFAWI